MTIMSSSELELDSGGDGTAGAAATMSTAAAALAGPSPLHFLTEFNQSYIRTRHNNLRCFPMCSRIHKENSFCGRSIEITVEKRLCPESKDGVLFGQFHEVGQRALYQVKDHFDPERPRTGADEEEIVLGEYVADFDDGSLRYVVTPPKKWHYCTKLHEKELHVFEVFFVMQGQIVEILPSVPFHVIPVWKVEPRGSLKDSDFILLRRRQSADAREDGGNEARLKSKASSSSNISIEEEKQDRDGRGLDAEESDSSSSSPILSAATSPARKMREQSVSSGYSSSSSSKKPKFGHTAPGFLTFNHGTSVQGSMPAQFTGAAGSQVQVRSLQMPIQQETVPLQQQKRQRAVDNQTAFVPRGSVIPAAVHPSVYTVESHHHVSGSYFPVYPNQTSIRMPTTTGPNYPVQNHVMEQTAHYVQNQQQQPMQNHQPQPLYFVPQLQHPIHHPQQHQPHYAQYMVMPHQQQIQTRQPQMTSMTFGPPGAPLSPAPMQQTFMTRQPQLPQLQPTMVGRGQPQLQFAGSMGSTNFPAPTTSPGAWRPYPPPGS